MASAHDLSENAWQRITDACSKQCPSAYDTSSDDFAEAGASLDGFRENLYDGSSP